MKYNCLSSSSYHVGNYSITTIRKKDLKLIKKWRNEQMDVLRQKTILTDADQEKYFGKVIQPSIKEKKPNSVIFSFIKKGRCIGYGGLTNIDWDSRKAELSFLVDTIHSQNTKVYRDDFSAFLQMILNLAFVELSFNRIFTETYDVRPTHVGILEKYGFRLEGRLKQHIFKRGVLLDSLVHGLLRRNYIKSKVTQNR